MAISSVVCCNEDNHLILKLLTWCALNLLNILYFHDIFRNLLSYDHVAHNSTLTTETIEAGLSIHIHN